jgi:hypothetical protein
LTAFDFNDHAKLVDSREHVTATQSEVQSSALPPAATTTQAERMTTSSPRNFAMAKELQLPAKKLKGVPLPEKSPSAFDSNLLNMSAFRLHSPSVSKQTTTSDDI